MLVKQRYLEYKRIKIGESHHLRRAYTSVFQISDCRGSGITKRHIRCTILRKMVNLETKAVN